jgi:hypothetical protein
MATEASGVPVPEVGSRFEFKPYRGARRVYEIVEVLPEGTPATAVRAECDRFKLRIIAESGFVASSCYGVGWEMWVELRWFTERTDARQVAA